MKHIVHLITIIVVAALGSVPGSAQDPDRRGSMAGRYAIDIGGVTAGWIMSAEGGTATGEVVEERTGAEPIVRKHLSLVRYEDFKIHYRFGMSEQFWDWLKASFDHKHIRKDGAIHSSDYDPQGITVRRFKDAVITEVCFPACDADAKDEAFVGVKFAPRSVTDEKSAEGPAGAAPKVPKQGRWIPSNFRLTIDGLDCSRVSRIEGLSFKFKAPVGKEGDAQTEPATLEVPNLVVTFSDHTSGNWDKWHHDFVIDGKNDQSHEKGGTLEFLSPDGRAVLGTLRFSGLGIFKLVPDTVSPKHCDCDLCKTVVDGSNSPNVRGKLKASLYCESATLEVPPPVGD